MEMKKLERPERSFECFLFFPFLSFSAFLPFFTLLFSFVIIFLVDQEIASERRRRANEINCVLADVRKNHMKFYAPMGFKIVSILIDLNET